MPTAQVQRLIIRELRAGNELSLTDLVARVRPHAPSGRNDIKVSVAPLLYRRRVTLTPGRKFRLAQ